MKGLQIFLPLLLINLSGHVFGQEKYYSDKDPLNIKAVISCNYEKKIPVYERPKGKVKESIETGPNRNVGIVFLGKTDTMYNIMAYDYIEDTVMVRGWIDRHVPLVGYTQKDFYSWTLYEWVEGEYGESLEPKVTFYDWIESFEVLDMSFRQIKGHFMSKSGDIYTGWLPYYFVSNKPPKEP